MFPALWNYIKGYVIIYVSGFSVERFINLALCRGIFIWDGEPFKKGMRMKVGTADCERLNEFAVKTGCRIEIEKYCGLPVLLEKRKRKKAYSVGILVFAAAMYVMSAFIWTVSVEGNERVNTEDILDFCEEQGIAAGRLKHGRDLYETGRRLMLKFKDIAWIAVSLEGTEVNIKIVETIPETKPVKSEIPTDVTAENDGKIISIAAAKGTPVVKVGDSVKRGDLLISSIVPLKDGEQKTGEKQVCASGEVYAERYCELEGKCSLNYNEKVFTGRGKTDYSVTVGNKNFNFIKPVQSENTEAVSTDRLVFKIGDYKIPFGIEKTVFRRVKTESRTYSEEEALNLARGRLRDKISALVMQTDGEISRIDTKVEKNGETILVKGFVSIIMRIDRQQKAVNYYEEVAE